ncbi:MAG: hemopexin repeat-containing protein [Adhaeribacter sp.]
MVLMAMCSLQAFAQKPGAGSKNGMLILGSDDRKTLEERVAVGYKLYASGISFDYIIVSGGCAAHKSQICEASEMAALLQKNGVPASIIFQEAKSKNTVQNYCYSRALRKPDGSTLIQPGDNLYVVSNHWHAIPVAARFTTHDQVNARYHIEGGILPKDTDKVNYTNIYKVEVSSEDFCRSALWPTVNASYSVEDKAEKKEITFHLLGDVIYRMNADGTGEKQAEKIAEAIRGIPANWSEGIDAALYSKVLNKVYLFKGPHYLRFTPHAKTMDAGYPKPLMELVKNLPANWQQGSIDATFLNPVTNEIFLFRQEEYLQLSARSGRIREGFPKKITTLVTNWPFSWGSGGIDAAHYNRQEGRLYLFKGKEYVKISLEGKAAVEAGYPQTIKLEWPEAILGKK